MRGEQPLLFVTLDGSPCCSRRARIRESWPHILWRWNYIMPYDPLVRVDGIWFAPRELTPF